MRVVLQRVSSASVTVDGEVVGAISSGLLLLVGVASADDDAVVRRMAAKCADLRIFPDDGGRFDRSILDAGGAALAVSQFTLLADVRRGRRPSFGAAAEPEAARALFDAFVGELRRLGVPTETGRFGAMMRVSLVNEGPVTIVIDSRDFEEPRRLH
ncbi:MAG TPA: D-aminoacyl-tRNA deacylase [Dehalococcoidia bacterium]|nr:D-aminoacyl-tRNA deacylase [Dehalococcoidia bacterium]